MNHEVFVASQKLGHVLVLLVEDDVVDQEAVIRQLKHDRFQFEVRKTSTLKEAFDELQNSMFDLVITDLMIPDSCGVETISRLQEQCPGTPLLVLTGHDDDVIMQESLKRGASGFLVKGEYRDRTIAPEIVQVLRSHRNAGQQHATIARLQERQRALEAQAKQLIEANQKLRRLCQVKQRGGSYDFSLLKDLLTHDELSSLTMQACQASGAKSEFLAAMSRELRTPLEGILSMNDLLMCTELSDKQRAFAEASRTNCTSLIRMLNDLIDIANLELGKTKVRPYACQPADIVREVASTLAPLLYQKTLLLDCKIDPMLESTAYCDGSLIREVIAILVSNAIKFTKKGELSICAEQTYAPLDGTRIKISVSDTGAGISPEDLERLQEVFTQDKPAETIAFEQTGTGLAICLKLMRVLEGRMGVESVRGCGSNFWFEIPLHRAAVSHPHQRVDAAQTPLIGRPRFLSRLKTENPVENQAATITGRALVAHGSKANQLFIAEQLKHLGYAVDTAGEAMEALSALRSSQYDLLLLDCDLPGKPGHVVASEIRQLEAQEMRSRRLAIVAIAPSAGNFDAKTFETIPVDEIVAYPVDIGKLRRAISGLIAA